MKTYHAVGLMSGSSLDGLDIALVKFTEAGGRWHYEWLATECMEYPQEWRDALIGAKHLSVPQIFRLHTDYGRYTGTAVRSFLNNLNLAQQTDVIASHGHTVFHDPSSHTTCQIGDGASIAAITRLPVVSDLRSMDMAFGGQGAPIVPVGEQLLFPDYQYWLNLGGIANITHRKDDAWQAFDICACNQVLNTLAGEASLSFDDGGLIASGGQVVPELLLSLNGDEYFGRPAPKSLDNGFSAARILPLIAASGLSLPDRLRTAVEHMAIQIATTVVASGKRQRLLATGGGALNIFLISRLKDHLAEKNTEVVVPDLQTVQFKEALIMALLGVLRLRHQATTLQTATGATEASVGGALWWGSNDE